MVKYTIDELEIIEKFLDEELDRNFIRDDEIEEEYYAGDISNRIYHEWIVENTREADFITKMSHRVQKLKRLVKDP